MKTAEFTGCYLLQTKAKSRKWWWCSTQTV